MNVLDSEDLPQTPLAVDVLLSAVDIYIESSDVVTVSSRTVIGIEMFMISVSIKIE